MLAASEQLLHALAVLALPIELLVMEYEDGNDLDTIRLNITPEPGFYTIKPRRSQCHTDR